MNKTPSLSALVRGRSIAPDVSGNQSTHQAGTGKLDWQARVAWLEANGYKGLVGLEYKPTRDTVGSLAAVLA